jgi:hypothetical protein
MSIFDFFKAKKPHLNKERNSDTEKKVFPTPEQKLQIILDQNAALEKEFKELREFMDKALELEKTGNFKEAIVFHLKAIEYGEQSKRLNFSNYGYSIERIIILFGKTKQKDKLICFLQSNIENYKDADVSDWSIRLSKLQKGTITIDQSLKPSDIEVLPINDPTLGKQLSDYKESLFEFNFYFDMPEGMDTLQYNYRNDLYPLAKSKKLEELKNAFNIILTQAEIDENSNNYKGAIEKYNRAIDEGYEGSKPFERLMIIYKKLKWKDQEIKIINQGVSYFKQLKENQRIKVLALAKKYGMEHKAIEYINSGQKIQYYYGAFDLYNTYPIISKWEEKIIKLREI